MARVAISEYKAKKILYSSLGRKYFGARVTSKENINKTVSKLDNNSLYVVKVDQGIKKRKKSGLLFTNVKKQDIKSKVKFIFNKGFDHVLIEKFILHNNNEERFLSLERQRKGILAYYSNFGGINIEENKKSVLSELVNTSSIAKISKDLNIDQKILKKIAETFENQHFSFLETNPFIIKNGEISFLDLAVEVDDASTFIKDISWSEKDFVSPNITITPEELAVKSLSENTSASLKLKVLNPKGSIFAIFSGGGASIVLADEIGSKGNAQTLANYAEYSGNPNDEETYLFCKNILSLVKKSPAKHKSVYIAGGVANFTDVRKTFKGIIRALEDEKESLKRQGVKIFVRRGGPNQKEGLKLMEKSLRKFGILGKVAGPDMVLTDIIQKS